MLSSSFGWDWFWVGFIASIVTSITWCLLSLVKKG